MALSTPFNPLHRAAAPKVKVLTWKDFDSLLLQKFEFVSFYLFNLQAVEPTERCQLILHTCINEQFVGMSDSFRAGRHVTDEPHSVTTVFSLGSHRLLSPHFLSGQWGGRRLPLWINMHTQCSAVRRSVKHRVCVISPQGAGSPHRPAAATREVAVEETAERLAQTEQLLSQLKMMIREKDAALCSKDEQLKVRRQVLLLLRSG